MIEQNAAIRRVLILLKSLDAESRAAILNRMPTGLRCQLELVDQDVMWCDEDRQESAGVAREFFEKLRGLRLERGSNAPGPQLDPVPPPVQRPAEFDAVLQRAPQDALQHLVSNEHPQTVAVIVAHLSPERAVSLLSLANPSRRADILQRIIDLEDSDPSAVDEIRNYLIHVFTRHAEDQQKSRVRMSRVQAMLGAADARLKAEIQSLLQQHAGDVNSASELTANWLPQQMPDAASTSVRFDRIVDVPTIVINKVFRSIPADVGAVALIGASQPARKDLLQRLPTDLRHAIELHLARLAPTRVADIHLAQQIVLSLIEKVLNLSGAPHEAPVTLSA